jgi:putative membrane protein
MSRYRSLAVAAALAFAVGCGGGNGNGDGASDAREGGGGKNGLGDDARPTAAERTGATGDSNRGGGSGMAGLSDEDRQFVQKASMSNQMEVTLGNLAEDKAQNDQVKQFGERLARDHEAANRELQSSIGGGDATTAQQPGGGTSTQPSAGVSSAQGGERGDRTARPGITADGNATSGNNAHAGDMAQMQQQMQQSQQKLERVSGQAFDRAYLDEMVRHHEQDIKEFERASQSDNPQIRQFAERTLPTLREHLQQAQQLQQSQGQGQGQRGRQQQ